MRADVDIRALRCFLALAQELSFGAAAQRMNITQPSLSSQIRKLEEQLGQPLFQRTTRAVALAPAGIALLPHARQFAGQVDAFAARLATLLPQTQQRLVLGAPIYTFDIPEHGALLSAIAREIPDISLRVDNTFTTMLIDGILKGSVDLAMVVGCTVPHGSYLADRAAQGAGELEIPDGLPRLVLRTEPIELAIPEEHPLAEHDVVPPEALAGIVIAMLAPLHGRALYTPISALLREARAVAFLPPEAHAMALERYCREYRIPAISIGQFRPREQGNIVYRPIEGLDIRTELALIRGDRKFRSPTASRIWSLAESLITPS